MMDQLTIYLTVTAEQGAPRVVLTISKTASQTKLRRDASEATKIPLASLKLIFRGRMIADDDTKEAVAEFKLEEGSVLHCIGKPVKGDEPAPSLTTVVSSSAQPNLAPLPLPTTTAQVQQPPADPLRLALQSMRASNAPDVHQAAVATLDKILTNIVQNPMEDKYRKVKKQNAAFQRKLGGLNGGDAAMKATGFTVEMQDGEEVYVMQASAEAWPRLLACKSTVEAALRDANSAATLPSEPLPIPSSSMPTLGGASSPAMNSAVANFLSDPNALQTMMQNPMVQNMIRNDPRFANDPMLQESMQQIASNPALAAQVSQMLRDPNMVRQMQSMVGGGSPPLDLPGSSGRQSSSAPSATDEEMTEDEMIAEAIRRSLEES